MSQSTDDRCSNETGGGGSPGASVRRLEELLRRVTVCLKVAQADVLALVTSRHNALREHINGDFRQAFPLSRSLPGDRARYLEELRRRIIAILEQVRGDSAALVTARYGTLSERIALDFGDTIAAGQPSTRDAARRLEVLSSRVAGRLEKARADLQEALSGSFKLLAERINDGIQQAVVTSGALPRSAARSLDELRRQSPATIEEARSTTLNVLQSRQNLLRRQIDGLFRAASAKLETLQKPARESGTVSADREDDVPDQLDLHGFLAEDALITLELFLQHAHAGGALRVSIIHGKGAGILRSAVRDYLPRHPLVESIEFGAHLPGDDGVTVAHLRRGILPAKGSAPDRTGRSALHTERD